MNGKKDWGLTVRGVVKKEGKTLILRRHPKSRNNPHKYELPGGKVDPGEFFDVALIREFKEETNLDVNIESLFEVVQRSSDKRWAWWFQMGKQWRAKRALQWGYAYPYT